MFISELTCLVEKSIGKPIYKFDSSLKKISLPKISSFNKINFDNIDLVFTALPSGEAQKISKKLIDIYNNKSQYNNIISELKLISSKLGDSGASSRAAELMLKHDNE